jgi:hypothetical protein
MNGTWDTIDVADTRNVVENSVVVVDVNVGFISHMEKGEWK